MRKLPTLLPKNPNNLGLVREGEPLYSLEELIPYLKIDGTACAIIDGKPYFRYDARRYDKKGRIIPLQVIMSNLPKGAISCQDADSITGHWPHWIPAQKGNRLHSVLVEVSTDLEDGTYEGIGPLINANPHNELNHLWVKHDDPRLIYSLTEKLDELNKVGAYMFFKYFFKDFKFEGLVFYKEGIPVAKLRRSDFGYGHYLNVSDYLK